MAEKRPELDTENRAAMKIQETYARMLFRGTSYKLDVYPIGGARIWGPWSEWQTRLNPSLWPGRGAQDNFHTP